MSRMGVKARHFHGGNMKQCSKCREILHFSSFDIRQSKRDGLTTRPECKSCRAAMNRANLVKKREQWDNNPELEAYRTQRGYRLEEVNG